MSDWRRYVRPQDLVWLLAFVVIAIISPDRTPTVLTLLIALGVVQVLEGRIGAVISVALKLALCWLLIYSSGGVQSSFYLILLLPVISAATSFGIFGTTVVSLLACGVYLSMLYFLREDQYIPPEEIRELLLRVIILPVVGYLTHQLAEASREETRKLQATAAQLAAANKNLEEAEAQMRRSDRLAALGQLTAGLAHELRNPLGTIKTSAELLTRNIPPENEIAREMSGYIASEVDRVNSLITRFLDFARPQHLRTEPGDIAALLDRVIERFNRERPPELSGVTVYKNYSPGIPPVNFDAELLERVFLNLIMNAAQAGPPSGVVTVKTRLLDKKVEVAVIDRGSGIDAKNVESIFNPFFTTKANGVGLGLAISSKIVDEHGGQISVESTPGEGSVFYVLLPASVTRTA